MKAYLMLENGRVFEGESFGVELNADVIGEVVFTTTMTGYLETLTDPSYAGLIVLQTFPLIGNYGVNLGDVESERSFVKGYIAKTPCEEPSNFRSEGTITGYLQNQGIPAVSGLDTREITRLIREHGAMNGVITLNPDTVDMEAVKSYAVTDALKQVRLHGREVIEGVPGGKRIVLWDCGLKSSQLQKLLKRGCTVSRLPSDATCEDVLAEKPDGVLISNGPGDPRENTALIKEIAKLTGIGVPIMGICLGHQLMALARGAKVEKLKYGHRGANTPVRDVLTGQTYITSQNHGYAVSTDGLPDGVNIRFVNINDGTCEGLDYDGFPGFSVQFHPEAGSGPLDTGFLFDRLLEMSR